MSRKVKTILKISACTLFTLVMCVSAYQLQKTQKHYQQEALLHQALLVYKPESIRMNPSENEPSAIALLRAQYPDVVGWITIPGTQIDYPFVQAEDNDKYLRADINGDYLYAGSIFMDALSAPDFSLFNTIIYGHNMKNGSMFGTLPIFRDEETFNRLTEGTVFLADAEYQFEIFACLLTNHDDSIVYTSLQNTAVEKQALLDYLKESASQYREIGVSTDDHILTLSTCSYEFSDARTVVVGRLVKVDAAGISQVTENTSLES